MPDHEEAVREARGTVRGLAHRVSPQRLLDDHNNALDTFERAIRASERAKYAALVKAASVEHPPTKRAKRIQATGCAICIALAALQSKEGTNK